MKQIKMQIVVQTGQLPIVQEVRSAMQIHGQKLVSQKAAAQTRTTIQTAIQTQAVRDFEEVLVEYVALREHFLCR